MVRRLDNRVKPIVASAGCLLIERGLLELDQPLQEIIPEIAEEQNGIRLLHFMTLFSNKPYSDRELGIVSNGVAASLVG